MDHRSTHAPGSQQPPHHHGNPVIQRRRSHSQPVVPPPPPISGPSYSRAADPFDFLHQYSGPSTSPGAFPPIGYDDDDIFGALLSMSDEQQQQIPSSIPFPPHPLQPLPDNMQNQQTGGANPLLTQTFLAWLQYVHLQNQLNQNSPQQQPQQQTHQLPSPFSYHLPAQPPPPAQQRLQQAGQSSEQAGPSGATQVQGTLSSNVTESPSPEAADLTEAEQLVVAEDKRRRNTAASARFRVKKKQWTLNLERSISDLSGRVEELEREAAELRRENGWLKEIVMLKSKRFGGPGPELDPTSSSGSTGEGHNPSVDRPGGTGSNETRESSTDSTRTPSTGKGKGRDIAG